MISMRPRRSTTNEGELFDDSRDLSVWGVDDLVRVPVEWAWMIRAWW